MLMCRLCMQWATYRALMSPVDEYFAGLDAATREAFENIRRLAMEIAPEAEDGTSYGMAALILRKKPLIGFRVAQRHLSIYPFSPEVIDGVRGQLAGYDLSKGTIRFTSAEPLPDDVVREIVRLRVAEITASR
jgi:uncharacterized protein YdhG (YjbR/CyaY superfamily)